MCPPAHDLGEWRHASCYLYQVLANIQVIMVVDADFGADSLSAWWGFVDPSNQLRTSIRYNATKLHVVKSRQARAGGKAQDHDQNCARVSMLSVYL